MVTYIQEPEHQEEIEQAQAFLVHSLTWGPVKPETTASIFKKEWVFCGFQLTLLDYTQ